MVELLKQKKKTRNPAAVFIRQLPVILFVVVINNSSVYSFPALLSHSKHETLATRGNS